MAFKQTTNYLLKICNETDLCCDKGVLRDPCCDPKNLTAINLLSKLCVDGLRVHKIQEFDILLLICTYKLKHKICVWVVCG